MERPIIHYQARTRGPLACGLKLEPGVEVSPFHQSVTCQDCLITPLIHNFKDDAHRSVCRTCRATFLRQS